MCLTGYNFDGCNDIQPYVGPVVESATFEFISKEAAKRACFIQCGLPRQHEDKMYNSLLLVNRRGELITKYDKHFLYYTDQTWACSGESFKSIYIPELGQVGFGICMDINPKEFKAPFNDFEFANFHLKHKSTLILCSMAWLDGEETIIDRIKYWVTRFYPFIMNIEAETVVAIANRCGKEKTTTFAGCSCVLKFKNGKVQVLGNLGPLDSNILTLET